MNQKQLELEMAKLEAEKDVTEAKERTEVAKLEAELAQNEYLELMLNDPTYIRTSLHDSWYEHARSHGFGCFRASVQVSSQEHPS